VKSAGAFLKGDMPRKQLQSPSRKWKVDIHVDVKHRTALSRTKMVSHVWGPQVWCPPSQY
jgi:hypothetical protein